MWQVHARLVFTLPWITQCGFVGEECVNSKIIINYPRYCQREKQNGTKWAKLDALFLHKIILNKINYRYIYQLQSLFVQWFPQNSQGTCNNPFMSLRWVTSMILQIFLFLLSILKSSKINCLLNYQPIDIWICLNLFL